MWQIASGAFFASPSPTDVCCPMRLYGTVVQPGWLFDRVTLKVLECLWQGLDHALWWAKARLVAHCISRVVCLAKQWWVSATVLLIRRGSFYSPRLMPARTRRPVILAQVLLIPTPATLLCCLICSRVLRGSSRTSASPHCELQMQMCSSAGWCSRGAMVQKSEPLPWKLLSKSTFLWQLQCKTPRDIIYSQTVDQFWFWKAEIRQHNSFAHL